MIKIVVKTRNYSKTFNKYNSKNISISSEEKEYCHLQIVNEKRILSYAIGK